MKDQIILLEFDESETLSWVLSQTRTVPPRTGAKGHDF